jgi:hypothetical protein
MRNRFFIAGAGLGIGLTLGLVLLITHPWRGAHQEAPPQKSVNHKPPDRDEFMLGQDKSENTRLYTYRDDKVRKVVIEFADGAHGYKYLDGTSADGKRSILTKAEEVLGNGAKIVYDFAEQDNKPVITRVTAYRPTKDGKAGTKFSVKEGQRSTFYQENGTAILATVDVSKSGFTFKLYEGLEPGNEAAVLEEVYKEEIVNTNDNYGYGGGFSWSRRVSSTTITVFAKGTEPKYRQIYEDNNTPNYPGYYGYNPYYGGGGGGMFPGRLGNAPAYNPYTGKKAELRPGTLEYTYRDSDQTERRVVKVSNSWSNPYGYGWQWQSGYHVSLIDRDGKETGVRYVSDDLNIYRFVDKTKTPEESVEFPESKQLKENLNPAHWQCPLTDELRKLRDEGFKGLPEEHLQRILVD